jgi:outer membrane protein assembly factor BamD
MKLNLKTLVTLTLLGTLCACTTSEEEELQLDPTTLYNDGVTSLNNHDYPKAQETFEKIGLEFPAHQLASEAEIKRAYALFLNEKYDNAVSVIDDFVRQYPSNRNIPYMYYLKSLCYFNQVVDVGRDQQLTIKAIDSFNEVINRFPNSPYARDAMLKKEYATNNLAGKEMDIGRFYLKSHSYIAAINRFKNVIEKYQKSIFIEEALYRVVEAYYLIGDIEQARRYASVLGHNYPQSSWYKDAYDLINSGQIKVEPWYNKIKKIW